MRVPAPEGVTYNNPFDLMDEDIAWIGRTGSHNGIVTFNTAVHGIRAGMIDARTKVYKDRLNTIDKFFDKFAPPPKNNTVAYKAFMAEKMGISEYAPIDLSTPAQCIKWALACNEQEVGLNPATKAPWFPLSDYQAAAEMVFA